MGMVLVAGTRKPTMGTRAVRMDNSLKIASFASLKNYSEFIFHTVLTVLTVMSLYHLNFVVTNWSCSPPGERQS